MTLAITDVELPVESWSDSTCVPSRRRALRVRSHGQTDPGRRRGRNEDHFLIARLTQALQAEQTSLPHRGVQFSDPQGYLFVVADGVGGHAAGEKASALALNTVESFLLDTLTWCAQLRSRDEDETNQVLADFQRALLRADAALFAQAREQPELRGMGTTLTLAFCLDRELYLAHVGDSRCYLLRGGLLYRLTRDHTLVADMVRRGFLRPDEAATHHFRHVITNVVGGSDLGVRVEMHKLRLEPGDRLLLCSDGLTEMVSDPDILAVLAAESDPARACRDLVARANEAGGKDNITVVVADVVG
jgi:protein phosphatase